MYDLIIKNGVVIDGAGNPSIHADVAVSNGKIARVGIGLEGAKNEIDARGLVVTPGFIDSHSHSDLAMLTYPDQIEKAEQGITVSVGGQCGASLAPLSRDFDISDDYDIADFGKASEVLRTTGTYLDAAADMSFGSGIAVFAGHRALRRAAMGMENREPTASELEHMKSLLRDAMEHGAMGISFGLIYTPSCYAKTDELIELAKVAAEYKGLVSAHIRDEGNFLAAATEEFITIIRESGARGVVSHHKAAYKENHGKVSHTLRLIEEANKEGLDIYCDVYPYTASHTSLTARFIPKEMHTGGYEGIIKLLSDPSNRQKLKDINIPKWGYDMEWVLITHCSGYPQYEGMRLSEISRIHGKDVYDTVFDLIEHSGGEGQACYFTMCEEDIETVMSYERAMICTDASVVGDSSVYHPRLRATFPRVLAKYVRERKVTSLHEMIRKMTSMPAAVYGLEGKGLIAKGYDADICIFDAEKICDMADYTNIERKAEGLNYVIIGGEIVVENSTYNGKRMGKLLRRNVNE